MKAIALGERLQDAYDKVYDASIKIQPINFELGEKLYNLSIEIRNIEVELVGDKDEGHSE